MKVRWPWGRRPTGHDITCREAVALITAYLDGALARTDHDRLERHLEECPHCSEHLKQIEATILVTGTVGADDLTSQAREDLMELYRGWRREREEG